MPFPSEDSAYSDSSVPPDEDVSGRQARFVIPETFPGWPQDRFPRHLNPIQSRSVARAVKHHERPLHATQKNRQFEEQLHAYEEQQREAAQSVEFVKSGQHEPSQSGYYQASPAVLVEAPETAVNNEAEPAKTEKEPESEYLKTTIEQERQVLKKKRPALKERHPLLKHFPAFFSYLDQDDGLDGEPVETEVAVKNQLPAAPMPVLPLPLPQQETALLIPPIHEARPPVTATAPPLPLPGPFVVEPPVVEEELPEYSDPVPAHHYTPQLSPRRPLLVPSLRYGLRIAMPLKPSKVPTSHLNFIPEPDYKTFDPLPRRLGSKVVDRFYSSNIVQGKVNETFDRKEKRNCLLNTYH